MLALPLLFYCAACLYRLGDKSLWVDEVLVPLTARYPVEYILQRSLVTDFHPPGYYLIIKLWSALSDSDAFLRGLSVLCGGLAVLACQRLGREALGAGAGLAAASALAVSPLFISLARQVRPYTLIVLLCALMLLGLWREVRLRRDGEGQGGAWPLAVALCLGPLTHYTFLFVILGGGLSLLTEPAALAGMLRRRKALLAAAAVSLGCSGYFLLHRMGEAGQPGTVLATLGNIGSNMVYLLSFQWGMNALAVAMGAACLFGLWAIHGRSARLARMLVIYVLAPWAALAALRYASYSNPWHYAYTLPALALCLGAAADRLCRGRTLPLALCGALFCAGAALQLAPRWEALYADESENYAAVAQAVERAGTAGRAFVVPERLHQNAVARYLAPEARRDFLAQRIEPGAKELEVLCVGPECASVLGDSFEAGPGGVSKPLKIGRATALDISSEPESMELSFKPSAFYSQVYEAENVQIDTGFGGRLMPTENNVSAGFAYRFVNRGPKFPYASAIVLRYANLGLGNALKVSVKFDDEAPQLLFATGGIDARRAKAIPVFREKPFASMLVMVEMRCAPRTPAFPGGNQQTIQVEGLSMLFSCYKRED